jgi:hypothetical protein
MKRIIMKLTAALVMAVMMMASVMPAFAQGRGEGAQGEAVGPQGGNPGQGVPQTQEDHPSAGESGQIPLPYGGTEPEAGLNNAPGGVVCTAPGSPFFEPELSPPCPE